tara:strand:- start:390 stop:788 length:399 start_codon:yes stop_codon:yes gene_type:complete
MPIYGPKWPLRKGNSDLFELNEDLKSQISFELRNLILTNPGENISDPNYGVGIRSFLFDPNTSSSSNRIKSKISSQISRYVPDIIVENVSVIARNADIDSNSLSISITYYFLSNTVSNIFTLDIGSNQAGLY